MIDCLPDPTAHGSCDPAIVRPNRADCNSYRVEGPSPGSRTRTPDLKYVTAKDGRGEIRMGEGDKGLGRYSRDLYVAVVGVAIVVVVLAVLGGMGIRRLYNAQELVFHSHRQVLGLERLMSIATDAETGQRGFLLTSD